MAYMGSLVGSTYPRSYLQKETECPCLVSSGCLILTSTSCGIGLLTSSHNLLVPQKVASVLVQISITGNYKKHFNLGCQIVGWFSVVSRKMIPHFDYDGIWRPHIIFTCSQNHSIFQTLYTIKVSINKLSQAKLISIAVLSMSRKCPVEPTDSYARSNQANGKFVWLINVCYQDWLGVVMKKIKHVKWLVLYAATAAEMIELWFLFPSSRWILLRLHNICYHTMYFGVPCN